MLASDNIYSNVIQVTQEDGAFIEMMEEILQERLFIQSQEPTKEMRDLRGTDKDGYITATDKVIHIFW